MNTELLLKVKAAILAEPAKFDMEDWFAKSDESPCGTTACIAGHAAVMHRGIQRLSAYNWAWLDTPDIARNALMIDLKSSDRLFYLPDWPIEFKARYIQAESASECSKVAADRIDHFIATNGAE